MPTRSTQRDRVQDTRSRIVEAARHLFWKNGYAATGLAEILSRAEANSGSFYHFFESKDELLREVLQTYVDLLEPQVLQPVWSATADPLGRVFALLNAYRKRLIDTGCQYGCPIGRLALEIDAENVPAHALIAANFKAWSGAVETCLRDAGLVSPAETAMFVLTVMEGAVMQARAYRRIDPFDVCVQQLRGCLDRMRQSTRRAPVARIRRRRQR